MQRISNNCKQDKLNEINVRVGDIVLTPLTCASIIAEVLKCAVYQKSQIPYHYNTLKQKVNWVRNSENPIELTRFAVERYFHTVSTAYDNLESIIVNLNNEFNTYGCDIEQVLIIFGSNVHCPREVFKIKFDGMTMDHCERNHSQSNIKYQHKILQNILFAEEWLNAMDSNIPVMSIFIMLQKRVKNFQVNDSEFLVPLCDYTPPSIMKCLDINLNCKNNNNLNCCKNVVIFEENSEELYLKNKLNNSDVQSVKISDESDLMWFQSKIILQGFKACNANLW